METLTIPRSKWKHGGLTTDAHRSCLHNPETGRDCCLGHLGRLRGIPDADMAYDRSTASRLFRRYGDLLTSFNFLDEAIHINDSIMFTQEEREQTLIALFLANYIELKFVD